MNEKSDSPTGPEPSEHTSAEGEAAHRWSPTRTGLAVAGVVLAVAAVFAFFVVRDHQARAAAQEAYSQQIVQAQADQEDSRAKTLVSFQDAQAGLDARIAAGEEALASTEGQVADNQVRVDLRAALDAALTARDTEPQFWTVRVVVTPGDVIASDERYPERTFTRTTATVPMVSEVRLSGITVDQAAAGVLAAQHEWAVTQASDAVAAAEGVLAGSEGKVADNVVREGLRAGIDNAVGVVADEAATVAALLQERDAVNAASQAVVEAQAAWQAEQDRIAAEQAAAAAAAERGSGRGGSSGGSKGGSWKGSGGGSKGTTGGGSKGSGGGSKGTTGGGSSSSGGGNAGNAENGWAWTNPDYTNPDAPEIWETPDVFDLGAETAALYAARANAGKANYGTNCNWYATIESNQGAKGLLGSTAHRNLIMGPIVGEFRNARQVDRPDLGVHLYTVDVYVCDPK